MRTRSGRTASTGLAKRRVRSRRNMRARSLATDAKVQVHVSYYVTNINALFMYNFQ